MLLYFVGGFILVALFLLHDANSSPPNFPPGPFRWPIIGNLNILAGGRGWKKLAELADKYNDLFSIKLGQRWLVVCSTPAAVKAITKTPFHGRFISDTLWPYWNFPTDETTPRKFIIAGFLGDHRNARAKRHVLMEKEIDALLVEFKKFADSETTFKVRDYFSRCSGNVVLQLIIGERYDYGDREYDRLMQQYRIFNKDGLQDHLGDLIPFMKYFELNLKQAKQYYNETQKILNPKLEKVLNTFDPEKLPRHFFDELLLKKAQQEKAGKKLHPAFTKKGMSQNLTQQIFNGSDAVPAGADWITLFAVNRPQFQERIYKELGDVLKQTKTPRITLEHRSSTPFFEAFIKESLRVGPVAPTAGGHIVKSANGGKIGKYRIPKGVICLVHIWRLHNNEKYWTNPETFDPERFLGPDSEGERNTRLGAYLPFSTGVLGCPGYIFAKEILYLLLANLFLTFSFHPAASSIETAQHNNEKSKLYLSEEPGDDGIVMTTLQHDLIVKLR